MSITVATLITPRSRLLARRAVAVVTCDMLNSVALPYDAIL
jgi:hypothetical protein